MGPLAAVSPETDRAVRPVLCSQQGIITFPCGAPALQQLSNIDGRDWHLIASTNSCRMADTKCARWADTAQAQTQRNTTHKHCAEERAHINTQRRFFLFAPINSRLLFAFHTVLREECIIRAKRSSKMCALISWCRLIPRPVNSISYIQMWRGTQRGKMWALLSVI